jgi:thiol:disulfide interchange protein DsbC
MGCGAGQAGRRPLSSDILLIWMASKAVFVNKLVSGLVSGLVGALVAVSLTQSASAQAPASDESARIQKTLQARLPKVAIAKVQPSQWPWLYEVLTEDEMFYVDTTGDYLFYGKVMDTRTRTDLTTRRWNELSKVSFDDLPLSLALKHVKGDGSRKIVVFSDPHCPYCVRFENTLQDVTNITVYTFLYPLESIHPGATETAKNIWCAPDRAATWTAWMVNKKQPAAMSCNAEQVATTVKLGEKLKVTGTPTVFFIDGHRVPGAMDKTQLEEEFKTVAAKN